MLITIQVNNRKIKAEKGETILSALYRNGIVVPTLCRMRDFTPTGACRICVVEVEGRDKLVTACSQPVEEWMRLWTHSPRVISARKTIVELLLSNHPDDCLYCDRNLNCELQRLSDELNVRERKIRGRKIRSRLDQSSTAIVRELSKCILCGRCVRICEETVTANSLDFIKKGRETHIGTTLDRDLNFSSCINCGQCVQICPTGALHEKHNINEVQEYLNKSGIIKIIQYSPVVPAGIAEELGVRYNRGFDKTLNAILRRIGFDKVFATGVGTDICIKELAEQLSERIGKGDDTPLLISACPSWIKYAEQFLPSMIPQLSTLKSPQQITGALIRTMVADQAGLGSEQIFSVSVTPCVAMKFEARREGMTRKGISDVDAVLTVRELARLIRLYGIDTANTGNEPVDEPLEGCSSAASIAEISGGFAEAILRSLHYKDLNKDADRQLFKKLRSGSSFREATVKIGDREVNVAVVDGLAGLEKLVSSIQSGKKIDLVEVMVCPGGCVFGAGMPYIKDRDVKKNRTKLIYQADEAEAINLPEKSPVLANIFEKYLAGDREFGDRKIFHTHFERRNVLL